jgi:hypothetical protein
MRMTLAYPESAKPMALLSDSRKRAALPREVSKN